MEFTTTSVLAHDYKLVFNDPSLYGRRFLNSKFQLVDLPLALQLHFSKSESLFSCFKFLFSAFDLLVEFLMGYR
jgi:hypothetical protein